MMLILADLPDHALTTRLLEIRTHERSLLVELLGLLAELDRRRTVIALGFSSPFSFCTDRLGLTKASAFRRTTAARLLSFSRDRRVPHRRPTEPHHPRRAARRARRSARDRYPGPRCWTNRGSGQAAGRCPPAATGTSRPAAEAAKSAKLQQWFRAGTGSRTTAHQAKQLPIPASPLPHTAPTPPAAPAQPTPAQARPSAGPAATLRPIALERHVLQLHTRRDV